VAGIFVSEAMGNAQTQTLDFLSGSVPKADFAPIDRIGFCVVLDSKIVPAFDSKVVLANSRLTCFESPDWWWRLVAGLSFFPAVVSVLMFGVFFRGYDSPSWLIRNGFRREAAKVLENLGTVFTEFV